MRSSNAWTAATLYYWYQIKLLHLWSSSSFQCFYLWMSWLYILTHLLLFSLTGSVGWHFGLYLFCRKSWDNFHTNLTHQTEDKVCLTPSSWPLNDFTLATWCNMVDLWIEHIPSQCLLVVNVHNALNLFKMQVKTAWYVRGHPWGARER